jgi:hypothetical protein
VYRWYGEVVRASLALVRGDLADAEHHAELGLAMATELGQPDALLIYGSQIMGLRWQQGRLGEIRALVDDLAAASPDQPALRAARCWLAAEVGDLDGARALLDADLSDGLLVPDDAFWLSAQCLWATAAARTRHREVAVLLVPRLREWHAQFVNTGSSPLGAGAQYLGLLAHALGDHDAADAWFAEALTVHEAMEAPVFTAWTRVAWADALVDRARPGDGERARVLLDAALESADTRGFGLIDREAAAVLSRIR